MAQKPIILVHTKEKEINIIATSTETKTPATILKSYLDQAFDHPFQIQPNTKTNSAQPKIILKITSDYNTIQENAFLITSDDKNITLIASNEKTLRYAIYTLLETWGFRKFTAKDTYIPKLKEISFPKNSYQTYKPSFEYRALFYPDCYDEAFRDWHKLDWHINDFGIWGHSFYKLLDSKIYFKSNPEFFALYEGQRNPESFCMTNDTVIELISKKVSELIQQNPDSRFFSISQNDDVVYCECSKCGVLNEKHGGPQGSFYYFLNKIAARFPKTRITTLAYLHTFEAPVAITIAPNIYTLLCPIQLNRGSAIEDSERNKSFLKVLKNWSTTTQQLYLWDYTVEFTNYLSPFPNLHTFSKNYKLFQQNQVKGVFVQGYADVVGDLYELRQYLLAKIIWDTQIDIEAVTNDFLKGYYGAAAPFIKQYIDVLTQFQTQSNRYLDIYTNPIQDRTSFLSLEAMDQYDQIISKAEESVKEQPDLAKRVLKFRLALEYVYFEQAKFFGKDKNGMFAGKNKEDQGEQLRKRVSEFAKNCNAFGIYELSEGGLTPNQYYEEWQAIQKNAINHLAEKYQVHFLTPHAEENKGKGTYGLVDGVRGYKNSSLNWIGWYGTNPSIEITTHQLDCNTIQINTLNDQRHWIFTPKKISVYGLKKDKWQLITQIESDSLTEDYEVSIQSWELKSDKYSTYETLKIEVENHTELPYWRKRKNKKPMVMLDEIEFYKK